MQDDLDMAVSFYLSTLALQSTFEPARDRLLSIQCGNYPPPKTDVVVAMEEEEEEAVGQEEVDGAGTEDEEGAKGGGV